MHMRVCIVLALLLANIACNETAQSQKKNKLSSAVLYDKERSEINYPIVIDVTKEYPKKEAICLQDIPDIEIEYIPLETNNEFLFDDRAFLYYMDDKYIILHNTTNGDILIFDSMGKAIRKINNKGGSGKEYSGINGGIVYDKIKNELYVNDSRKRKIFVYDIEGKFKRALAHQSKNLDYYINIYNYNENFLLCYNFKVNESYQNDYSFDIISKQTGEKEREIDRFLYDDQLSPQERKTIYTSKDVSQTQGVGFYAGEPVRKSNNFFLLNQTSADTIYKLTQDFIKTPVIIQTPTVKKSLPTTFLTYNIETPLFHVLTVFVKRDVVKNDIEIKNLIIDKKTGEIFNQDIYDGNFTDKKPLHYPFLYAFTDTNIVAFYYRAYDF